MKFCEKHGRRNNRYSFCPICGSVLQQSDDKWYGKYILPNIEESDDEVLNRALNEARASAWHSIGVCGNVSYFLSQKDITPKSLQHLLKSQTVQCIGGKVAPVIKMWDETDFSNFDMHYNSVSAKGSWAWQLAEWFCSFADGTTHYQYDIKKNKLKSQHSWKIAR